MTRSALLLLLAALPALAEDAKKAELAKLAGAWKIISLQVGGREVLQADTPEIKVTILADRMKFPGAKDSGEFMLKIDPTTNPKVLDVLAVNGNNKGDVFEGIYELAGDTLQICIRTPAGTKDRPTEFASKVDTGLVLLKFERAKDQ